MCSKKNRKVKKPCDCFGDRRVFLFHKCKSKWMVIKRVDPSKVHSSPQAPVSVPDTAIQRL
ncbi:MAG: hypothetical protein HDR09_17560 [Lachnospiraceae bacterium]|nr:hypothetical protein [Lachnospiraceae bacterium]MBD5505486.1 hypothetical protein [Lachnospiraceae bacterium]